MSPFRPDLPGSGDPYGTGGGLSGIEDLLARPPQPKPYYRPYERNSLTNLIEALRSGLDPSTAFQMLSGIQGEAGQRHDEQRAMQQQTQSQASDALLQLAQTNPDPAAASTYLGAFSTLHPNMGEQTTSRLDELVSQLYPGGGTSPLMPPGDPSAIEQVDPDTVTGIQGDVQQAITAGLPLRDTRMRILQNLQAQGLAGDTVARMYSFIGQLWSQLGGDTGGRPITWDQRQAELAGQWPTPQNAVGLGGLIHAGTR